MGTIKKLFFNWYSISIPVAVVITLMLLLFTKQYRIKLISSEVSSTRMWHVFHDLNNDGNSERIRYTNYSELKATIMVLSDDKILEQIVIEGQLSSYSNNIIGDYDNDGRDEIFAFSQKNDSLFLHCVDYLNSKDTYFLPVCKLARTGESYIYDLTAAELTDLNSDGTKEIIFAVNTGFSLRPRKLFILYPSEKKLISSPESCAILHNPDPFDIDNDGMSEIFCNNQATGNCSPEIDFSDLYGWLMVFTPELHFKFPPVRIQAYSSDTKVIPFKSPAGNFILVFHWYRGSEKFDSFLGLYDIKGNLVKKRVLSDLENLDYSYLFQTEDYDRIFLQSKNGKIYRIDNNLSLIPEISIKNFKPNFAPVCNDIDRDGKKEIILLSSEESTFKILRNNFSGPVSFTLPSQPQNFIFSLKNVRDGMPILVLETYNGMYFFEYSKSTLHKYRLFSFVLILFVSYAFVFIFFKIHEFRNIKILNSRNQLAELQLKSIQNQIDPHFTFNLLDSFANLINEHDTKRAEYIFGKYSGLLKSTVLNSDKIIISLNEEIDFIKSYLDLEKFRYQDKFDYEINIDPQTDTTMMIPKMLLHIFVENAVKHGLKHLDKRKGKLTIDVLKKNEICEITIFDNGIGRKKAAEMKSFSTGRGLKIIEKMLELNYNLLRKKISFEIDDLVDGSQPAGTRVGIYIHL